MANKQIERICEKEALCRAVICAMLTLDDEKWLVLFHKYYNDLSYDEIGLVLDISPERVQTIEQKAMRELRHPNISRPLRIFL